MERSASGVLFLLSTSVGVAMIGLGIIWPIIPVYAVKCCTGAMVLKILLKFFLPINPGMTVLPSGGRMHLPWIFINSPVASKGTLLFCLAGHHSTEINPWHSPQGDHACKRLKSYDDNYIRTIPYMLYMFSIKEPRLSALQGSHTTFIATPAFELRTKRMETTLSMFAHLYPVNT
ncbi:MAG: hypothetical protein HQK65_18410 [Desulfamplus sp.]|nr:hypothetical protein [Desulfamplus sp.]